MISPQCAAAADLAVAGINLDREQLTGRVSDVVGRPYAHTVVRRAVNRLHASCPGCPCQCRTDR